MVDPLFDYQFRIILIGDSMVGKSSLIRSFVEGHFSESCEPTVGVDFFARLIDVTNGRRVKLQIWDTAGQEKFKSITKSYYRNSVGVIFVYDITKQATFNHLQDWVSEAQSHIDQNRAVFAIVGHKSDMEARREVSLADAKEFARFNNARYYEASAKTGGNVEEVFQSVASDILELLTSGKVQLAQGWDGIKQGYGRPVSSFNIEPEGSRSTCCLWN